MRSTTKTMDALPEQDYMEATELVRADAAVKPRRQGAQGYVIVRQHATALSQTHPINNASWS